MLYIVECSYADPESEAGWNRFYSEDKLPALVSVSGFRASQRFRALSSGCPVYLAIHTIEHGDTLASEAYRQKGGGSFSRWQPAAARGVRSAAPGSHAACGTGERLDL